MKAKKDQIDEIDDEEESSGGSSKGNLKKYIKVIVVSVSLLIILYNLFLSDDDSLKKNDIQIDETSKKMTKAEKSEKYAKKPIDLTISRKGNVYSSKELEQNQAFEAPSNITTPSDINLAPPDVPDLPDFKFEEPEKIVSESNQIDKIEQKAQEQPTELNIPPPPDFSKQKFNNTMQVADNQNPNEQNEVPQNPDVIVEKKTNAPIFVVDLGTSYNRSSNNKQKSGSGDDFVIFDKSRLIQISGENNANANAQITQVVNLENMILQGKMMDVVLETAINSQLPGTVRGIIARDVFGESGTKILIPKGTRVYGSYSSTIARGQSRLNISWNRVIRPDGLSIAMSASASDQFGRTGIEADTDNRFAEVISNTLLLSFVNLGTAVALQKITGTDNGQTQVVNNNGSVATTNINPVNMAAQTVIQSTTDIIKNLTEGALTLSPIATLPQGTKINIIANQDITIPDYKKGSL